MASLEEQLKTALVVKKQLKAVKKVFNKKSAQPVNINVVYQDGIHSGSTPLHLSFSTNKARIVRFLIEHGADISIAQHMPDGKVNPSVCVCAAFGDPEMMGVLLGQRANINEANSDGLTPLHIAAARDDYRMVHLLLNMHARTDQVSRDGRVPADMATSAGVKGLLHGPTQPPAYASPPYSAPAVQYYVVSRPVVYTVPARPGHAQTILTTAPPASTTGVIGTHGGGGGGGSGGGSGHVVPPYHSTGHAPGPPPACIGPRVETRRGAVEFDQHLIDDVTNLGYAYDDIISSLTRLYEDGMATNNINAVLDTITLVQRDRDNSTPGRTSGGGGEYAPPNSHGGYEPSTYDTMYGAAAHSTTRAGDSSGGGGGGGGGGAREGQLIDYSIDDDDGPALQGARE